MRYWDSDPIILEGPDDFNVKLEQETFDRRFEFPEKSPIKDLKAYGFTGPDCIIGSSGEYQYKNDLNYKFLGDWSLADSKWSMDFYAWCDRRDKFQNEQFVRELYSLGYECYPNWLQNIDVLSKLFILHLIEGCGFRHVEYILYDLGNDD
jgi:hypothetical protein